MDEELNIFGPRTLEEELAERYRHVFLFGLRNAGKTLLWSRLCYGEINEDDAATITSESYTLNVEVSHAFESKEVILWDIPGDVGFRRAIMWSLHAVAKHGIIWVASMTQTDVGLIEEAVQEICSLCASNITDRMWFLLVFNAHDMYTLDSVQGQLILAKLQHLWHTAELTQRFAPRFNVVATDAKRATSDNEFLQALTWAAGKTF